MIPVGFGSPRKTQTATKERASPTDAGTEFQIGMMQTKKAKLTGIVLVEISLTFLECAYLVFAVGEIRYS